MCYKTDAGSTLCCRSQPSSTATIAPLTSIVVAFLLEWPNLDDKPCIDDQNADELLLMSKEEV
jgi:hypothetical protein